MDVTQTQQPTTQQTTSSAPPVEEKTASAMSSDFETFLKMLTVQMQNQDPLNPIESTEYAVQLATFSSVEQQVQTNDLISALSDQLGVIGMAQTASWVGKEVKSDAPVQFDGDPISLSHTPDGSAETSYLVVRNSAGTEVQRLEISPSDTELTWDGVDRDGYPFDEGAYKFTVENHKNSVFHSNSEVTTYGTVSEARRDGGKITLVLEGGVELDAEDVQAIREPELES